jgi:hypothetical protein
MRYENKRKKQFPPKIGASEGSVNHELFFGSKFSTRHIDDIKGLHSIQQVKFLKSINMMTPSSMKNPLAKCFSNVS